MSCELLGHAYESTEQLIQQLLEKANTNGATIAQIDSVMHLWPILNFMASMRAAAVVLKFIDCTDQMAEGGKKDAVYIAFNEISVLRESGANVCIVSCMVPASSCERN